MLIILSEAANQLLTVRQKENNWWHMQGYFYFLFFLAWNCILYCFSIFCRVDMMDSWKTLTICADMNPYCIYSRLLPFSLCFHGRVIYLFICFYAFFFKGHSFESVVILLAEWLSVDRSSALEFLRAHLWYMVNWCSRHVSAHRSKSFTNNIMKTETNLSSAL